MAWLQLGIIEEDITLFTSNTYVSTERQYKITQHHANNDNGATIFGNCYINNKEWCTPHLVIFYVLGKMA